MASYYVESLRRNNTQLLQLALQQLPFFGVDITTVRSVNLNHTSLLTTEGSETINSTNSSAGSNLNMMLEYLINVQYIVTLVSHDDAGVPHQCAVDGHLGES
jgi:hypothetical protein